MFTKTEPKLYFRLKMKCCRGQRTEDGGQTNHRDQIEVSKKAGVRLGQSGGRVKLHQLGGLISLLIRHGRGSDGDKYSSHQSALQLASDLREVVQARRRLVESGYCCSYISDTVKTLC